MSAKTVVSLRLDEATLAALDAFALRTGRTRTEVVAYAVQNFLSDTNVDPLYLKRLKVRLQQKG